jgi:hypothetical protein
VALLARRSTLGHVRRRPPSVPLGYGLGYGGTRRPFRATPKRPLTCTNMVGDTGIEPVTSSVSAMGSTPVGVRWRPSVQVVTGVWSWADVRGCGRTSAGCYTGCCQRLGRWSRDVERGVLHSYAGWVVGVGLVRGGWWCCPRRRARSGWRRGFSRARLRRPVRSHVSPAKARGDLCRTFAVPRWDPCTAAGGWSHR